MWKDFDAYWNYKSWQYSVYSEKDEEKSGVPANEKLQNFFENFLSDGSTLPKHHSESKNVERKTYDLPGIR